MGIGYSFSRWFVPFSSCLLLKQFKIDPCCSAVFISVRALMEIAFKEETESSKLVFTKLKI